MNISSHFKRIFHTSSKPCNTYYLTSIGRFQFGSNAKLAVDLVGSGDAVKLIGGMLGPKFIEDKPLVDVVLELLGQNYTKTQMFT